MNYNPLNNPLQAVINEMSRQWQQERSGAQLTLGTLLEALHAASASGCDLLVPGITEPHSYRGYYEDLAFELEAYTPIEEAIQLVSKCMGRVFEGYKGGSFMMGETTPLWAAMWGDTGLKILSCALHGGTAATPAGVLELEIGLEDDWL